LSLTGSCSTRPVTVFFCFAIYAPDVLVRIRATLTCDPGVFSILICPQCNAAQIDNTNAQRRKEKFA
jgi:hypothetical protein